jgi:hypothetical protein
MRKFWCFDPSIDSLHWGAPYTGETPAPPHSPLEQLYHTQIMDHAMDAAQADRLLCGLDVTRPWYRVADFMRAVAALASVYQDEIQQKSLKSKGARKRGTPLRCVLAHACSPTRLQFLFNNLRLLHTLPAPLHGLLATGTTANEVTVFNWG